MLCYHRVGDSGSGGIFVGRATFRAHVEALVAERDAGRLQVVPSADLPAMADTASRVSLTFDDGWADATGWAVPLLCERGLPVTLFVTPELVGQPGFASARVIADALEAGAELGAHSMTHADLRTCDPQQLDRELRGARESLEDTFGRAVDTVAYPSGLFDARVEVKTAAAGYRAGFTSERGPVTAAVRPTGVPRVMVEDLTPDTFLAMARGGSDFLLPAERLRHRLSERSGRGGPPAQLEEMLALGRADPGGTG